MDLSQELSEFIINNYLKGEKPDDFNNDYALIDNAILDSLAIMNLLTHMESTYGIDVGENDIVAENFESISKLTEFLMRKMGK